MGKEQKISLYIHVPFCRAKCPYCSFYSVVYDKDVADGYIEALSSAFPAFGPGEISTIYIGGGTPTVLDFSQLKKLLGNIRRHTGGKTEFTIEANPESLSGGKIRLFLDYGINRLSIGIQSLADNRLSELGRIHNSEVALNAVRLAHKAGFRNINVDFMAGLPKDRADPVINEIKEAVNLPITHFSFYMLSYEKGTPFYRGLKNGRAARISDEIISRIYGDTAVLLGKKGFRHYEVSNFARKGFECRHNLNYWDNSPYIGLGPSACSYVNGVRSRNTADILKYIENIRRNKKVISFSEKLSPEKRAGETAAFKVRTADGIDFSRFKDKTGFNLLEAKKSIFDKYANEGILKYRKRKGRVAGVSLTKKGFLFCDLVSRDLLF